MHLYITENIGFLRVSVSCLSKITKTTLCLPEHILLSVLQCSGFHPTSQLAMLVKVFPLQISPHFLPRLCSGKTHTPGGRSLVDHH